MPYYRTTDVLREFYAKERSTNSGVQLTIPETWHSKDLDIFLAGLHRKLEELCAPSANGSEQVHTEATDVSEVIDCGRKEVIEDENATGGT